MITKFVASVLPLKMVIFTTLIQMRLETVIFMGFVPRKIFLKLRLKEALAPFAAAILS